MDVRELESVEETAAGTEVGARNWRLLATVVATGVLAWAATIWLTPAAAREHEASFSLLGLFFETAFWGSLFVAGYAFVEGRDRLGYAALASVAWVQLAAVIACPATGHHGFGAWWAGQMALCIGFVAVSTVASAISLRAPEPGPRSPR
jgi:hypothetical protein